MKQQPTLRTARLTLRPFALSDSEDIKRLAGDRAIADTTLAIPHPYEDGMADEWIATHQPAFEAGKQATFAVLLRDNNALIGVMALEDITVQFERAELGYWIAKEHWNHGYCTEAGRAALKYGFTELQLNRICSNHLTRNPASGRVMQKLGMKHEGTGRQHAKKWGVFEDLEFYGILKSEWEKDSQDG